LFFAVCDFQKPLDDPDPNGGVVTVDKLGSATQIRLPENYPLDPVAGIQIAVFNCDGKSSSVLV
jgi:hypothetical protein